jgi:dethiobiotin synthetase
MMRKIFVTGIGTDVGKTVVSAILVEKLKADYWKPVQAGSLNETDTMRVKELITNTKSIFHPEAYCLSGFMSPHAAANIDGIKINLSKIKLPFTKNHLIIEGAGGLMVPLNNKSLVIDLIQQLKAEVILVSKNYLGSINHTLLSIELLKNKGIKIAGIVFNGLPNEESESFILKYSGLKCLAKIKQAPKINPDFISKNATTFLIPN